MQKGGQLMPRLYRTFCILVHPQRVLVHSQTLCQTRNLSAGLGPPLLARNCVPNKSHMITINQSLFFFFTKIIKCTPTSQTFMSYEIITRFVLKQILRTTPPLPIPSVKKL